MESYRDAMHRARREYLAVLLDEYYGHMPSAAKAAGVRRTDLYKLIAKYAPQLRTMHNRQPTVRARASGSIAA